MREQAVLGDFIAEGHFGRHIRRMREVYAERLSVLLESSERYLRGLVEVTGIEAGLQIAGWLSDGMTEMEAVRAAAQRDVELLPLSRYTRAPLNRAGVQMGFAAVDPPEIRRGARELAMALGELRSRGSK